ncbi:TPA: DUF2938 domain-containing protein [Burkholderia aenigmatica]|uniref:DUF2938 domain-containing protein n=1 Tax=Burkholderia sp. AU45251 TaxID=3059204 RepID=UPI00264F5B30|nr:DUF2938 domain-containing protein [Burkholderia sp. AU45251]HDR9481785.1 DUF2938 domain-containing protein [Burkholderia aenigmatica]MDN7513589.1 DUF2938 domain-containing protein [Burkholderia sp. AU45251]HDR9513312.1 DUF2938 domain-containing protein [Burkholderia aenigmatica]HDR9590156.1 DUF2938 domain-containing protein [Burkholderia aenigmatica]HDR9597839.1 DUF2938 domain-containing protein [Burkholderia aenigmatica]
MSAPDVLLNLLLIGAGATLVMDLWTLFRRRAFGIPSLDYALVGRWIGHMMQGRFRHVSIGAAAPVPGERALGWIAHYAIGIAFAALPVAIAGTEWIGTPTPLPALLAGLASVIAPFFVMQPAFGFGVAASRTPNPGVARRRSLITHLSYGVGLYLAAVTLAALAR